MHCILSSAGSNHGLTAAAAAAVNSVTTVTSAVSELTINRLDSRAVPRLTNPRNRDVTDADFPTSLYVDCILPSPLGRHFSPVISAVF